MKLKFSWFAGPLAAIAVVAWTAAVDPSPGLATLGMLTSFTFMFAAPLIQFLLLRTNKFRGRDFEVCTVTLLVVSLVAITAGASGVFNFW